MALRVEEPSMSFNDSMFDGKVLYENREHSNWMSLMIMKSKIIKNIRGSIPTSIKDKEFLPFVE